MIIRWFCLLLILSPWVLRAQLSAPLFSDVTLRLARDLARQRLQERTIGETCALPFDAEHEDRYQSAFWAISQFHFDGPEVMNGFQKAIAGFPVAGDETRRACLEALHAIEASGFQASLLKWLPLERNPKIFAMTALFLHQKEPTRMPDILRIMTRRWPDHAKHPILSALSDQLHQEATQRKGPLPPVSELFDHQQGLGTRNVYSFQRWDRDQPGLAVVQGEDGRFVRDSGGRLITITQLARSGSNLPYFITNGNTPQGIFRILGLGISANRYIGPTPNLQLLMPFEGHWADYLTDGTSDSTNPEQAYLARLPDSWRKIASMREAFRAGNAGRSEIIAHGTTIDPDFFIGTAYHPISPTLGCLCAREDWDPQTGLLRNSDQLLLAETYRRAPGRDGYLFVINLDDSPRPVNRTEVERLIEAFERNR